LGIFTILIVINRLKVDNILIYLLGGILMWFFMLKSGVHATITGVLLAFAIPFRSGDQISPSYKVWRFLDKPVPLLIVPIFVLANTAIQFPPGWYETLIGHNTLGIFAGLFLGKPLGIVLFSYMAVKSGLCRLSAGLSLRHLVGMGALGGIGFTMSIFIANLAFTDAALIQNSKIAVFSASLAASLAGLLILSGQKDRMLRTRVRTIPVA
jgi:Na+:H+ antiporter, NhaA family